MHSPTTIPISATGGEDASVEPQDFPNLGMCLKKKTPLHLYIYLYIYNIYIVLLGARVAAKDLLEYMVRRGRRQAVLAELGLWLGPVWMWRSWAGFRDVCTSGNTST